MLQQKFIVLAPFSIAARLRQRCCVFRRQGLRPLYNPLFKLLKLNLVIDVYCCAPQQYWRSIKWLQTPSVQQFMASMPMPQVR